MDGMVEENGTGGSVDALVSQGTGSPIVVTSVHSVIQANQQSVIQTATQGTMLTKGNVILLSKPNSVIQTPQGNIQTLQVVVEAGSDESLSANEDSPKRGRHDALTRRPSYRKILNDIAGGKVESSGSDCDSNLDSELSSNSLSAHYQTVPGSIQLNSQGEMHNMPTLTMSNATSTGGTILQYASQDGQFFVPVVTQGGSSTLNTSSLVPEDQVKKREMRLLKNREAARECRRKKKEYIKCLENRVSVLENQNKALIEELKALKELYCQTKTE
ncbi:cyclic AMP-responsive element-binding protein 1 isoform X1 [Rhopalosiphum padi]|uniref:cyclic AMP-responsive element-binding protein 1 isoform X1 n=1 Tax=Rhopalosiphum padi TaxID=40932 RepID=UPI00298DAAB9|nr:cyclic AMP-responsive element-binding protein 1 isoform X1 [Rhopalosiphum padi]XP_060850289.1 cyclic AMP-responsive element-binding protein 1 isoform X1 [Rhopalosiphum padi]